ncbi:uncharacterized protein KD926_006469 [Aspergillus affinis]|uniref:uncharacterized protein n=1 Tax=Aspergillus affinis TaxID=1070780 RepID=UPI0022FE27CA|nr:uncharacterized protein KD926_006469 [Aspergillus affinis]KAI9041745.1 hypothetical protein KD926_006469 [Aspergillus affinis]
MSDITKTRIACNLCRRQKIRCDKAQPACENCRDAGVECVFTPLPRRKKARELPGGETRSINLALPQWPTRYVVEQVIGHFTNSQLYTIFPIVNIESLTSLLNANSLDPGVGMMNPADRACLVAFTAFITHIEHHELAFLHANSDSYLQAALSLVPQLIMEHTNTRALEALLIMALYIAPLGQPQTAQLLLSMAIRILYNLGGHTIQGPLDSLSPSVRRHHEHLRHLFWMCYSIDTEMSLRKCQAPLINDADCNLELPAAYRSTPSPRPPFTDPQQSFPEVVFNSDLRMVMFKSKVYRQLYSRPSLEASVATRLRLIRELDHELHELKALLPHSHPETPSETSSGLSDTGLSDASARGHNIRSVMVNLEYYHCLTKIHGASLVGHDVTEESSAPSSLELCYQAARSTLLYLSRMPELISEETFWISAQFLLTAVLALHYRLITRRHDTSHPPHEDLSILRNMLDVFVQLKNNNIASSPRPFEPFIITEAFIRYLINLSCSP